LGVFLGRQAREKRPNAPEGTYGPGSGGWARLNVPKGVRTSERRKRTILHRAEKKKRKIGVTLKHVLPGGGKEQSEFPQKGGVPCGGTYSSKPKKNGQGEYEGREKLIHLYKQLKICKQGRTV